MMITLLTNFLKASSIVGALSIGLCTGIMAVPQTPPRVIGGTPPAVLTGLCGTIKQSPFSVVVPY